MDAMFFFVFFLVFFFNLIALNSYVILLQKASHRTFSFGQENSISGQYFEVNEQSHQKFIWQLYSTKHIDQ